MTSMRGVLLACSNASMSDLYIVSFLTSVGLNNRFCISGGNLRPISSDLKIWTCPDGLQIVSTSRLARSPTCSVMNPNSWKSSRNSLLWLSIMCAELTPILSLPSSGVKNIDLQTFWSLTRFGSRFGTLGAGM